MLTIPRRPGASDGLESLLSELATILESAGLFRAEAQAMIETWKDSWFEEGLLVLYVLPREEVDRLLPLQITPTPRSLERVMVGRIELITPEAEQEVVIALKEMQQQPEAARLESRSRLASRFGRFLEPIVERIARREPELVRMWQPHPGL